MTPDEMSAIATWIGALAAVGTLLVACLAARYAKVQIDKAAKAIDSSTRDAWRSRSLQRQLQTEQAQPYWSHISKWIKSNHSSLTWS